MERVIAYVDGYNLYYGLRSKAWKRYYWLNIQAMARHLLKPGQELVATKYFTTIMKQPEDRGRRYSWRPSTRSRTCASSTVTS